jgi:[ribosomal protein S18]-alanine N-acetyltransferase
VTEGEAAIVYRPMTVADVEQVYTIDVNSFTLPWSSRSFRYEVTENPASHPWVAEWLDPSGQSWIVGMLVIWQVIDEAHVGTFATHPHYRRRGIGQHLLAHALLDAYQHGIRTVFLEVRRSNLNAQALYRKFGFVEDGVRLHYYVDNNEDALLMTLQNLKVESLQHLLE